MLRIMYLHCLLAGMACLRLLPATFALSLGPLPSFQSDQRNLFETVSTNHKASRRSILIQTLMGGCSTLSLFTPSNALADTDASPKRLSFQTLDSGVKVADILVGNNDSNSIVQPNSKVNVHITGRLLGKQGWIFEDSQATGEDPFRLDLGTGTVITGLEEGLQGMRAGGRRRIVIPSVVGYTNRSLEPIPRDFGNRQRLYTTVMNTVRIEREQQALGADLAGVVVMDVDLIRIRN